ncbi:putative membrane-anchored protein [Neolewinella xylanilytica]|uniref:Putative membrane-anchored protein n=1 Tax=Neolewinella xylanilytica TaxID=1514080 RepID=A0A2S6I132_9BACT|nr:DUF2167 domain-containing protein [Neolewinella xylanilytica]PPK84679.1 putative membrane-anchored protein [Neolewinella xylanilytica]
MKNLLYLATCAMLLLPASTNAQEVGSTEAVTSIDSMMLAYQRHTDSIESTLTFLADTTVQLGDNLAALAIPAGYRYVNAADAETVLVDLWGNMPGIADGSYGMLFPDSLSVLDDACYGIHIYFTEDGYVDDADAADIDYADLLDQMRDDMATENEARAEAGYQTIELIGWAQAPSYDAVNKRLHWAKELYFEGEEGNTLNYNVRFLGRRGYLTMNVIGGISDLPRVNENLDGILASVAYNEGHRYADFSPGIDEVAGYGIAALVAGKVLAKTGLLASIGIFLLKGWKLVMIALVAAGAGIKKMMGKS